MHRDFARTPYEPEPIDESKLPGRSWKRTLVILGLAFVVAPLLLFGSRFLLSRSASGTITFGPSALDCSVDEGSGAFQAGSPIYAAVVFERGVAAGEMFTRVVRRGAEVISTAEFTVEDPGNCGSDVIDSGTLAPGQYRVTYSEDDEVLADGTFDVK